MPTFPVSQTDALIWAWLVDKIKDPEGLEKILYQAKEDSEKVNAPIKRRLAQLAETERAQEGKVELLLGSVRDATDARMKAMLERLLKDTERVFKEVSKERADLRNKLSDVVISDAFIQNWKEHAHLIKEGADEFTFAERREHIGALNITGTLAFEEGERIIYIHIYNYTERKVLATVSGLR